MSNDGRQYKLNIPPATPDEVASLARSVETLANLHAELADSICQLAATQSQLVALLGESTANTSKAINLVEWHQGAIDAEFEASPNPLSKFDRFFDPKRPPGDDGPPIIPFRA